MWYCRFFNCPARVNDKNANFESYEQLEHHWTTECTIARSACNRCDAEIPRNERAKHNCLEALIFNRNEHYEYVQKHEENIKKAHMNDERLVAITLGKGEEIEKEPMR